MEPGSRVELPPRGADISFLSNNPETDTPSKWLTFNSTPGGGNTTPGTAFGSPFWGSLAAANGLGTSNTPTTANFHHGKNSPKSYSPSKELNPFELSFFPKHNEHLLAPVTTVSGKDANSSQAPNGSKGNVKHQDGEDVENAGNSTNLSSSVSSLKRPFQSASSLQSDASSRAPINESGHPLPSWKRPKIEDSHMSNPSSSDLSSNAAESGTSAYAPSPSNTLNMNPSPDSGSPASSIFPTPSLQHATLPSNATSGAIALFNHDGKTAIPPEQAEVAKLAPNGITGNVNSISAHPHRQHAYTEVSQHQGQGNILTQSVPPPMSATFNTQQTQHQPGGHPYGGYTGYTLHAQQQAQPVILPAKTLQQAQQLQRTASPVTSHPPQSARQGSLERNTQQQSPVLDSNSLTTIPYANGRGPARPSRSTRSSNHNRRGSTAPAANAESNDGIAAIKQEEDINMYDSSSTGNLSVGALDPANYNIITSSTSLSSMVQATQKVAAASAAATSGSSSKKGKKSGNNGGRATSVSGSSSGKKGNNHNTSYTGDNNNSYSAGGDGVGGNGIPNGDGAGDDEEDGDDEHKRKAFLERNRQAACRSRQKKKEWINNLETHAATLQSENQSLASEIDTLRKELFALRHTLSFHERSGCTAAAGPPGSASHPHQQHSQNPVPQPSAVPASAPVQQSHQPQSRPEWQQQQQPHQQQSQQQQSQQQPAYQQGYQQNASHMSQPSAIVQTHPAPQPHAPSAVDGQHTHPVPVHIQTQPQPLSARQSVSSSGPTLAPSALQGISFQITQPHLDQQNQLSNSQQRAPPKLNLSPASLQPQSRLQPHLQKSQLPSHDNYLQGNVGDINRPGSAGATFGLATPNFADLFNGAMGKIGNGGQTPAFGAGLLFTPGGIMSSGGMLGGGSSSYGNSTGYNMSPGLPNTFGLSIQDIPIRPASAPPTPSPALDTRLMAPSQDYFSSKNLSPNLGTSAAFADFLAAYPNNALHANNDSVIV